MRYNLAIKSALGQATCNGEGTQSPEFLPEEQRVWTLHWAQLLRPALEDEPPGQLAVKTSGTCVHELPKATNWETAFQGLASGAPCFCGCNSGDALWLPGSGGQGSWSSWVQGDGHGHRRGSWQTTIPVALCRQQKETPTPVFCERGLSACAGASAWWAGSRFGALPEADKGAVGGHSWWLPSLHFPLASPQPALSPRKQLLHSSRAWLLRLSPRDTYNDLGLVARTTEACAAQDCIYLRKSNVLKPWRSAL